MLKVVFKKLDDWLDAQNLERRDEGTRLFPACEIKVVGQTALLESMVSLHVPATMDIDVFANYEYPVMKEFERLLKEVGRELDPVGHEAWMPKETKYTDFYIGKWVKVYLADIECVLISKAAKAPRKNKGLIAEYLASSPGPGFFELAKKYKIDLAVFLE